MLILKIRFSFYGVEREKNTVVLASALISFQLIETFLYSKIVVIENTKSKTIAMRWKNNHTTKKYK